MNTDVLPRVVAAYRALQDILADACHAEDIPRINAAVRDFGIACVDEAFDRAEDVATKILREAGA